MEHEDTHLEVAQNIANYQQMILDHPERSQVILPTVAPAVEYHQQSVIAEVRTREWELERQREREVEIMTTNYNKKRTRNLALTQLIVGGLAIILNSVGLVMYDDVNEAYRWGNGIWCPIFFYSWAGICGLCTYYKKKISYACPNMIFSGLSSLAAGTMSCQATWAFLIDLGQIKRESQVWHPTATTAGTRALVLSSCFVLTGWIEFVVSMWSTSLCYKIVCPHDSNNHGRELRDQDDSQRVRFIADPDNPESELLVLDSQGRPMEGTHIAQVPVSSQAGATQGELEPDLLALDSEGFPIEGAKIVRV